VAGDLLDDRMVLAQGVGTRMTGLALATTNVPAVGARTQVEAAATLLAGCRPRHGGLVGSVGADRLGIRWSVEDFHVG
jgi:hypothetical protein